MKTPTTLPMTPASQPQAIGIQLPCPRCGESLANIDLHLATGNFSCQECNEDFDADLIRDIMARWPRVLAWVETMPRD